MIQPEYAAQGSLWITSGDRPSTATGPIREEGLLQSYAWLDLLRSFAVLDPVVVAERLYLEYDPEQAALFESLRIQEDEPYRAGAYRLEVGSDGRSYRLVTGEGLTVETGEAGGPIGAGLGLRWTPPASELVPELEASFTVLTPRDAAVQLRGRLITGMDELGTFIQLSLRHVDPERAASVLAAVMERHVELSGQMTRTRLDATTAVLEEQLGVVEGDLREAERQLESFRVVTITLPTDAFSAIAPGLQQTRAPVLNEFFDLRTELEDVRRDRVRLEAVLDSGATGLRVAALELLPAVQSSSQLLRYLQELTDARTTLEGLRQRYTEEHELVRTFSERVGRLEGSAIPEAARAVLAELRTREGELEERISNRSEELSEIPPRVIEEARLERRVQIANALYVELRQRFETASLAMRSSVPDVQILDRPAVPTVPQQDERARWAVLAFGGVFGLALGLVFLLDIVDPRLRDPVDVMGQMGLSILGTVPHMQSGAERALQVREAFRELRTNVEFAHGAVRPLVLCVTSPAAQEGKTFVSANLAMAFGSIGRRTLLVDGDTRRGDSHELFGLRRKPGLTEFLATRAKATAHAQQSSHENLWVLTSGSRSSASPELLNSRRMQDLLAAAKRHFDVIIIDSPPLSAGADAFVLAAHAGSLVVVLRSGSTNKALTMVKMESLLRLPVRILGAVLNDFVPSLLFGNYRYYGSYIDGYEATDEPVERPVDAQIEAQAPPALKA